MATLIRAQFALLAAGAFACAGVRAQHPTRGATMDAGNAQVVVVPEETDALLANPGMGWQTFHRTSKADRNLPDWIPSTVHYARWGWGKFEPEPGKIDTAWFDGVLKETHESGQQLAFRVMCCSTTPKKPYHPAWLKNTGGRLLTCRYHRGAKLEIPDLDDPKILEPHLDFLRRLGARYDGHPDIDHVDLGSVGWWGEWHLSGTKECRLPSLETRNKIVDTYIEAFPQTPLLMLIGGRESLSYATRQGTGWRADCLGDMGGFGKNWCHMKKGYPGWFREAGLDDVWKTAPVAWETCWDMRKWVKEDWPLRYIFDYALAAHASHLNNKSAPLPDAPSVRPEVERFLRRLGYRFVLRELRHASTARPGSDFAVRTKWQNVGSAPCYRPYKPAFRLSNGAGFSKVWVSNAIAANWLPGSVEAFSDAFVEKPPELPPGEAVDVQDTLDLPADIPPGRHTLEVSIVNEQAKPVIRLAIEGRATDGWYPLSSVAINTPD